jgi:hypothetical protein
MAARGGGRGDWRGRGDVAAGDRRGAATIHGGNAGRGENPSCG